MPRLFFFFFPLSARVKSGWVKNKGKRRKGSEGPADFHSLTESISGLFLEGLKKTEEQKIKHLVLCVEQRLTFICG